MDFALILVLATIFTFGMWVADRMVFSRQRREAADAAVREFDSVNGEAIARHEPVVMREREEIAARALKQPWWLDYTAGLFPVILAVLLLRSFIVEPFRIPSGSMLPTLYIGDMVAVNKFAYGLRLPVIGTKIVPTGSPERGDVIVFKYPMDTSVTYIKRVVGLPGDTVKYVNKRLYINDVEMTQTPAGDWVDPHTHVTLEEFAEQLGNVTHRTVNDPRRGTDLRGAAYDRVGDGCQYAADGFVCRVPAGNYFMLGDNRDNSEDSRYWGFVPDEYLIGRAFCIWANFSDMTRIGSIR